MYEFNLLLLVLDFSCFTLNGLFVFLSLDSFVLRLQEVLTTKYLFAMLSALDFKELITATALVTQDILPLMLDLKPKQG